MTTGLRATFGTGPRKVISEVKQVIKFWWKIMIITCTNESFKIRPRMCIKNANRVNFDLKQKNSSCFCLILLLRRDLAMLSLSLILNRSLLFVCDPGWINVLATAYRGCFPSQMVINVTFVWCERTGISYFQHREGLCFFTDFRKRLDVCVLAY